MAAADFGADVLGFVFYPQSPRCVKPDQVRSILAALPPYVVTVGVFANQAFEEVFSTLEQCALDLAQLQGDESPDFCQKLGARAIKAIRVKDQHSIDRMKDYSVRGFVLDAYQANQLGGTGECFDWNLALQAKTYGRIILAGGLTAENVSEAVSKVQPYGVDVSSGVEERVGKKDLKKLKAFIQHAKEAV